MRACTCRVDERLRCGNCGGLLPWPEEFFQIPLEDGGRTTLLGRGQVFTCAECGHRELRADAA